MLIISCEKEVNSISTASAEELSVNAEKSAESSIRIIRQANRTTGGFDYYLVSKQVYPTTNFYADGHQYTQTLDEHGVYQVVLVIKDDGPFANATTHVNHTILLGTELFTEGGDNPNVVVYFQDGNGENTDPIVVTDQHIEEDEM